jgi:E3 ubiquitin-protein ligase MYCBP2
LKFENRHNDEKLIKPESQYFNKPTEYAMAIFSYYLCCKCKKPYFGGLKDCERALEEDRI